MALTDQLLTPKLKRLRHLIIFPYLKAVYYNAKWFVFHMNFVR